MFTLMPPMTLIDDNQFLFNNTLGVCTMPLLTESVLDGRDESMVTYKFKCPDLADHFEAFNAEQTHVILEGALNIIFGHPSTLSAESTDTDDLEQLPTPDELPLNHEDRITADVGFALQALALNNESGLDGDNQIDDSENLENQFSTIVEKLANDIGNDKYNQDVITLYGEMEFFNRIELYTYNYSTEHGILSVTVTALPS